MTAAVLVISRRPEWAEKAADAAWEQHQTVAVGHGISWPGATWTEPAEKPYAEVIADALDRLRRQGITAAIKWDDHDTYPADHTATVLRQYEAGTLTYGRARLTDCATGRSLRIITTIGAGVIPTDWTPEADPSGRIGWKPPDRTIQTGVRKRACGDWSWADRNPYHCEHRPLA